MAKVKYVQGKKASYLALGVYSDQSLYFCTDTHELYKGSHLYSDGIRFVQNYASLPEFNVAADGILYYCKDTGSCYVLNEARDAWLAVLHGIDNDTIGVNGDGLLAVTAVPIAKVTGLTDELQRVEAAVAAASKVATAETAGVVKPGDEFAVDEDGTISLVSVSADKVAGLEDRLSKIENAIDALDNSVTWENI